MGVRLLIFLLTWQHVGMKRQYCPLFLLITDTDVHTLMCNISFHLVVRVNISYTQKLHCKIVCQGQPESNRKSNSTLLRTFHQAKRKSKQHVVLPASKVGFQRALFADLNSISERSEMVSMGIQRCLHLQKQV